MAIHFCILNSMGIADIFRWYARIFVRYISKDMEFLKGNVKEMWKFLLATRAFFLATARFYYSHGEYGEWLAEALQT
jgi:hypothetical protein